MPGSAFENATMDMAKGMFIAYREQDSREPVVFVHGAIDDLRTSGAANRTHWYMLWSNQL